MNVLEAIQTRRSVRSFQKQLLPAEAIAALEQAILHSPSGSNAQESHVVIVQNPRLLRQIKRFSPGLSGNPAALLILCSNRTEALQRGGEDTAEVLRFVNLGITAANVLLTAHSLGIGSCPVRSFHQQAIKSLVNLPEEVDPELLISLGYADQPPRPKTMKEIKEVISYDEYGNQRQSGNDA